MASSLNEQGLILFAEQLPQIRVVPVADRPGKSTRELAESLNTWSVQVVKAAVNQRLITEARRQMRRLQVYTENDPAEAEQLKNSRSDAVFSDSPELLIGEQRESFHGR